MTRVCWGIVAALVISATSLAGAQTTEAPSPTARPNTPEAQTQQGPSLDRVISLALRDVRLEDALAEIAKRGGVELQYTSRVVPVDRRVTIEREGVSVREALERVLNGTQVTATVTSAGKIALVRQPERQGGSGEGQQSGNVYGVVTDSASGEPVENVLVRVKETNLRASTNERGQYQIADVPTGVQVITTRLLGYLALEKEVTVAEDQRARADFALRHSLTRLQEVVTTATGRQRRMELGNDITVINADSIVRTEPISSVTDLLESRVPGLTVQRTSGAPGDPARIRIRGASSLLLNNDPIVIVDGVRVYAAQSDERGQNLANRGTATEAGSQGYAAPSPLDYMDPHSIETIEVLKGPSAATLYGQDAANGVIVISTKKGRAGPPRWTVNVDQGRTAMAGSYPDLLLRWGHRDVSNIPVMCPITDTGCQGDSVVTFQLLNDPELTILDHGRTGGMALGVSGGSSTLTYAVNGNYRDAVGLVALPEFEAERFRLNEGTSPPDWMQRPQNFTQWGGTSRLTVNLGTRADVSLSAQLARTSQQRSAMERQIGPLMATYLDRTTGTYYRSGGGTGVGTGFASDDVLIDYYERARATATSFTNSISANWRPRAWLTSTADAGLNVVQRGDEILLPRGLGPTGDTLGRLGIGQGTSVISTVNLRTSARAPIGKGFELRFATGVNYTGQSIADLTTQVSNLALGTGSVNDAAVISGVTERRADQATYGWYVAPSISGGRLFADLGLRLDGGSTFGTRVRGPAFPKLNVSYVISDEEFFPFKSLLPVLRLRMAYGHAGQQPGPVDRLRLYSAPKRTWVDGRFVDAVELQTLGNTELRPERSREFEGGFDAEAFNGRLTVELTAYRKTRIDAIQSVELPPSVYGQSVNVLRNVGVVRNSGLGITLRPQLLRSDPVTWGTELSISRSRNVVVEIAPDFSSRGLNLTINGVSPPRVGYPLDGRWSKPILGYADANQNGVLDGGEVLIGDTAVFVGGTAPNYTAELHSTLSLLRGAVSIIAGLSYEDGVTQRNDVLQTLVPFSRGRNDPNATLAEQAKSSSNSTVLSGGTDFGMIQTVSTLRFNSLSVTYNLPLAMAQRLVRARAMSLSLQGTNLGLKTNYSGLDPNVNRFVTGNGVADTGVLPQPRTWQLRVNASY